MSKVNIYLDAGTVLFYSHFTANIEAKIVSSKSDKIHLYGRAGYGIMPIDEFSTALICDGSIVSGGLVALTFLTGSRNNHFEANLGVFLEVSRNIKEDTGLTSCDEENAIKLPVIELAYRYQKPGGGFIFRGKIGTLGLGISLGHAF